MRYLIERYIALGSFAIAAIGVSAVGTGPAAFAATPATQVSNLKQTCAKEILTRPRILNAELKKPGQEYQSIFIQLEFEAVDPACTSHFKRLVAVRSRFIRRGHLINLLPVWDPLLSSGDTNEASTPGVDELNSHQNPKLYFKHGDRAQFQLRIQVRSLATNKIVKTVVTTHPIKVHGG